MTYSAEQIKLIFSLYYQMLLRSTTFDARTFAGMAVQTFSRQP